MVAAINLRYHDSRDVSGGKDDTITALRCTVSAQCLHCGATYMFPTEPPCTLECAFCFSCGKKAVQNLQEAVGQLPYQHHRRQWLRPRDDIVVRQQLLIPADVALLKQALMCSSDDDDDDTIISHDASNEEAPSESGAILAVRRENMRNQFWAFSSSAAEEGKCCPQDLTTFLPAVLMSVGDAPRCRDVQRNKTEAAVDPAQEGTWQAPSLGDVCQVLGEKWASKYDRSAL